MKHEARQNEVLLRAVWRVWKAHERGRLVERAMDIRLLKRVWAVWMLRLREQRRREGAIQIFQRWEALFSRKLYRARRLELGE